MLNKEQYLNEICKKMQKIGYKQSNIRLNMIHAQKQKPDIVKAMAVIEPEEKIKMLEELPNDLLSVVITQIDARVFADTLINRFPEVLAEIIAG